MDTHTQLKEIKQSHLSKCKPVSRMGIATESTFSILNVNKKDINVKSKIQTKPVKEVFRDPNQKTPFERNIAHFFDSKETQDKLFKAKASLATTIGNSRDADRKRRIASALPTNKSRQQQQFHTKNGDDRHSYIDLKLDLPEQGQYHVNDRLVHKNSAQVSIKPVGKTRPLTCDRRTADSTKNQTIQSQSNQPFTMKANSLVPDEQLEAELPRQVTQLISEDDDGFAAIVAKPIRRKRSPHAGHVELQPFDRISRRGDFKM